MIGQGLIHRYINILGSMCVRKKIEKCSNANIFGVKMVPRAKYQNSLFNLYIYTYIFIIYEKRWGSLRRPWALYFVVKLKIGSHVVFDFTALCVGSSLNFIGEFSR